jgi:hypothetical protein
VSSQESRCEPDSEQPPDYSMMLCPRPSASVCDHAATAGGPARCNLWVTPTGGLAHLPRLREHDSPHATRSDQHLTCVPDDGVKCGTSLAVGPAVDPCSC